MNFKKYRICIIGIFLLFTNIKSISQSKTTNWFSGSLNKQDNELLVVSNLSNIFERISFGIGFGFGFDTKLGEKSSLNYGMQITTNSKMISINKFNFSSTKTNISFPFSFRFDLKLNNKNSIVIFNGVNSIIQANSSFGLSMDDFLLSRNNKKGIFPLYQGCIGYNWKKKGEHQVLLKYNFGFIESGSISLYRNDNLIYQQSSSNTYFEIEYRIIIPTILTM